MSFPAPTTPIQPPRYRIQPETWSQQNRFAVYRLYSDDKWYYCGNEDCQASFKTEKEAESVILKWIKQEGIYRDEEYNRKKEAEAFIKANPPREFP